MAEVEGVAVFVSGHAVGDAALVGASSCGYHLWVRTGLGWGYIVDASKELLLLEDRWLLRR